MPTPESNLESFKVVVRSFEESSGPLYASSCCGRVFVGFMAPTKCRTCPNNPVLVEIQDRSDEYLESLAVTLNIL